MGYNDAEVYWILSVVELSLSLVFLVLPCWYFLWRWRAEHHMITKACMLLLVPDFFLVLNFLPKHLADLSNGGVMVEGGYCTASAFQTVASILASNVGNIVVAYVTKRMLDPKDQKVTTRTILAGAAIGWVLGICLASFFYARGYLGSHRGVYCCTNVIAIADVCGPVFFCYAVCIAAMSVLYYQAWTQVKVSVVPSLRHKEGAQPEQSETAYTSSDSKNDNNNAAVSPRIAASPRLVASPRADGQSSVTAYGGAKALSPAPSVVSGSRNERVKAVSSASTVIARRGIAMVLVYYSCWFVVSLNAVFELAGWSDRSVWWDSMGALLAKAQPAMDSAIMLLSMYKVHQRQAAIRARKVAPEPVIRSLVRSSQQSGPVAVSQLKQRTNKSTPVSPKGQPLPEAVEEEHDPQGRRQDTGSEHQGSNSRGSTSVSHRRGASVEQRLSQDGQ